MKTIFEVLKMVLLPILVFIMVLLSTGCSPLDLLPTKPTVGIEATMGDKNQALELGSKELNVEDNSGTITETTNKYGLTIKDFTILLLVLTLLGIPASIMMYQLGLRTPRPIKHTSEGRKK